MNEVKERFYSKVKILGKDDCWEWQANCHRQGYGKFWLNGQMEMAHIVSWTIEHNDLPTKNVLHTCGNKKCVNPKHLSSRDNRELYIKRFFEKIDKTPGQGPNYDCWGWTSTLNKDGYGQFRWIDGKAQGAHRVSWIIHNGSIPDKMHVCHKCDNPSCVNPEHLFLGTHKENMQDRERKGRRTKPKGELNGKSKLKEKEVIEIKKALANGTSCADLGRKYNVTKTLISFIKNGKSWGHVKINEPKKSKDDLVKERFWSKVNVGKEDECWNWTAYKSNKGYGVFNWKGMSTNAHRVAWEITNNSIPEGKVIIHRCSNHLCCNPMHLELQK